MLNPKQRFEDFKLVIFKKKIFEQCAFNFAKDRKLNNAWSLFLKISANTNIAFSLVPATISTNLHNTSSLPKRLNPW